MISIRPSRDPVGASKAHLLPCGIQHAGNAPVSVYFKPRAIAGSKREFEAAFRGRRLRGVALLPAGYTGALLQDTVQATVADGEERRWMHRGTVEEFTYWTHDDRPTDDEPIMKCMRWTELASTLHGHHGEEDEEAAITGGEV